MAERSLKLLEMDPKFIGTKPKRPNPGASTERAGAHPLSNAFSWFLRHLLSPITGSRFWAGTGAGPAALSPPERSQGVPKESPVTMEPKELSAALLQAQVTVVAILGELLATLPTREEEEMLLESSKRLHSDLKEFTEELRATLHCIDDTWRRHKVTNDDYGPLTFLSRALAFLRSTPQTTQDSVAMAATKWHQSVSELVGRWAQLAGKATELRDTCRVATEAMTARVRELQAKAAPCGKAEEHRVELGQGLGGEEGAEVAARRESQVKREDMEAASEANSAAMVTQQMWAALGLLQCLMAACDKATALPRELQRLLRDIKADLEGTKKKSPNNPKDLVAMAERLWEANAQLARNHLLGIIDDILDYYSKGGRARPRADEVAKWCQRATEDISRLLRHSEHTQGVPKVSPVSTELQKPSPALLQPQVTVVATLGELLDTLPTWEEEMQLECPGLLHRGLKEFTKELWFTLHCIDDTWRRHIVTDDDDDDPVTFLSCALAALRSTPQTTQDRVTMAARKWQRSVAVLVDSWGQVAGKATELRDTCRKVVTEALIANIRERKAKAAHDGTAQEHSVELGQALSREEGAKMAAGPESPVREEARVAASEATRATMVKERVWAALGLLERLVAACDEATTLPRELQHLVAACDEATAFPEELQRLLRDTKTALEGTSEAFPTVPKDLVAKVAVAERLWEANARLAKDHLLGIIDDFLDYYSKGGRASPSAREVAKRCQRVIEDIPNLLQDDDVTAMTS